MHIITTPQIISSETRTGLGRGRRKTLLEMLTVGSAFAHSVTVVDAVSVTVDTVVVTGGAVTVLLTTIVGAEAATVEIVLTVVMKEVMDRQEQAEEISDEAKAVR